MNCDRCVADAKVHVQLPNGTDLMLCGHHFNDHRDALVMDGAQFTITESVGVWRVAQVSELVSP
jgi:hypothetical protein